MVNRRKKGDQYEAKEGQSSGESEITSSNLRASTQVCLFAARYFYMFRVFLCSYLGPVNKRGHFVFLDKVMHLSAHQES